MIRFYKGQNVKQKPLLLLRKKFQIFLILGTILDSCRLGKYATRLLNVKRNFKPRFIKIRNFHIRGFAFNLSIKVFYSINKSMKLY